MEDNKYWRARASNMRERAAHTKDTFVSGGFLALAEQYELLAQGGARWVEGTTSLYRDEQIEVPADNPPALRAKPNL